MSGPTPEALTTALAHALMDYDAELYPGLGLGDMEKRELDIDTYRAIATRIVLPRLWEAGLATWALGQENTA